MHVLVAVCVAALAGPGGAQLVRYSFNFLGGPTSRVETLDASGTVRGAFNYLDSLGDVKVQYYDYAAQVGAPAANLIEPAQPPQAYQHSEPVKLSPEPAYEPREPVYDAPKPAHDVTEHTYDAPDSAHEASDPAQAVPDPAQEAPEYVQEATEPIPDATESAQDVPEPAQDTPEPPSSTPAPASPTTPEQHTDAAEPNSETPEPRQDATEAPPDIIRSFGQRLRALARPSYAFPPRRAARRFRNRRAVVVSNSVFPHASPRFTYQPLAYVAAAPAAARDAVLLHVAHSPGHATSYRVD